MSLIINTSNPDIFRQKIKLQITNHKPQTNNKGTINKKINKKQKDMTETVNQDSGVRDQ